MSVRSRECLKEARLKNAIQNLNVREDCSLRVRRNPTLRCFANIYLFILLYKLGIFFLTRVFGLTQTYCLLREIVSRIFVLQNTIFRG